MTERKAEYQRPPPEVFVVGKGEQEERLDHFNQRCRPLYGSDVRVDAEGNIYYPTWRQVEREQVGPEVFSLLSGTRESGEVYLGRPLTTKKPYELRINRVTKEGGTVEVAIRAMNHVIEGLIEKEQPQMRMVRGRVAELFDLFADFSAMTDDQFQRAERETYRRLTEVEFDPKRVVLEEKQRIGTWLPKASGGKDSLGRRNWLITTMALEAAHRRAVEREMGIGEGVTKFVRMREALRFEEMFCREIFREIGDRLEPESMPAHYNFKYPQKPPQNVGPVMGILKTIRWQLGLPRVNPYRRAGMAAREILDEVIDLFEQDKRVEIMERDLFGQVRAMII